MRRYYSYNEYLIDCQKLLAQIDWEFDAIMSIARGGLTLSHMLGEYYGIRKVYTVNTIGYEDVHKLDKVEIFNMPDLKDTKKVLIVDDIVDSGDTMRIVLDELAKKYPKCEFKSAVLFYKTSASIKPDWHAQLAEEWIYFFWSDDLKREKRN